LFGDQPVGLRNLGGGSAPNKGAGRAVGKYPLDFGLAAASPASPVLAVFQPDEDDGYLTPVARPHAVARVYNRHNKPSGQGQKEG